MYTNGSNSNGNGNGHKRITLPSSNSNQSVGTLDDYPEVVGEQEGKPRTRNKSTPDYGAERSADEHAPATATSASADERRTLVLDDDDAPATAELLDADERRGRLRRVLVAVGVIACAVLLLSVVAYFWLFAGTKDDAYRVRTQPQGSNAAAAANAPAQALTADEIKRELERGNANTAVEQGATTQGAPQVGTASLGVTGGDPVTDRLPLGDFSATVTPTPATGAQQGASTSPAAQIATGGSALTAPDLSRTPARAAITPATPPVGNPNPERSIRVSTLVKAAEKDERGEISAPSAHNNRPNDASPASRPKSEGVPLPPLGSMLPVRTLGTLYTLRSEGYVRMQLTRAVAGQGWSLKRGAELYGVLRGSDFETGRAHVELVGFIEPDSGRLVRLQGSLLGTDGAEGLRGRKHKLGSGWSRALRIAGAGAVEALSTVAATVSRRPVYVGDVYGSGAPRATSPLMQELNGVAYRNDRAGFVEVPAGTSGYVLVMTRPREVEGVDADVSRSLDDLRRRSDASRERAMMSISDAELAELMTNGSHDEVRRALPRMTPEMRRVAEAVLAGR